MSSFAQLGFPNTQQVKNLNKYSINTYQMCESDFTKLRSSIFNCMSYSFIKNTNPQLH